MKKRNVSFLTAFVFFAFLVLLYGCAIRGETVDQLLAEGARGSDKIYTYGYGIGETRNEALGNAEQDLARQILSSIRGEIYIHEKSVTTDGESYSNKAMHRRVVAGATNLELESAHIDTMKKGRDGWYVRIRIDKSTEESLCKRARRQQPTLDHIDQIMRAPDCLPGKKLKAALQGLATARHAGIEKQGLYHPDEGKVTFQNYLLNMISKSVSRMRVLPLVEENYVRFAIIDRDSFTPQDRISVHIQGQDLKTDSKGRTPRVDRSGLSEEIKVYVTGHPYLEKDSLYKRLTGSPEKGLSNIDLSHFYIDSFYPSEWNNPSKRELFVYTQPEALNVIVSAEDFGREYSSPHVFRLPRSGEYKIRVRSTKNVKGRTETIKLNKDAPYGYVAYELNEKKYGTVEIEVRRPSLGLFSGTSKDSKIVLKQDDEEVIRSISGTLVRDVEVGKSDLLISMEDREDYQVVTDSFVIRQDQKESRRYREPIYREPYYYGNRVSINYTTLDASSDEFMVPWVNAKDMPIGDLKNIYEGIYDVELESQHLSIRHQRFLSTMNLTYHFTFGLNIYDITVYSKKFEPLTIEGDSFNGMFGIGLWSTIFYPNIMGWVTGNYSYELYSWKTPSVKTDNAFYCLEEENGSYHYPSAEAGLSLSIPDYDSPLSIALSVVQPGKRFEPHVLLSIGLNQINKDYRYPEKAKAQEGIHWERMP